MNEDASLWVRLGTDFNGDGRFTVSDLGSLALDILILPGDAFLYLLINHLPGIAEFFELGTEDYGGVPAIWAAIVIWLAAIIAAGALLTAIRDFDRKLTSWVLGRCEEIMRRLRILRRRIGGLIAFRLQRQPDDEDLIVESVSLKNIETAVLRRLSSIEDGDVLTVEEIAAGLKVAPRDLQPVIWRLAELGFVERGSDSFTRKSGHRIGAAGQMYLIST